MRAELRALRRDHDAQGKTIERMAGQIDTLLGLAERSKGGLWVGMTLASIGGGVLTWIAERLLKG